MLAVWYETSLGSLKSDFFEILIYLFSKYTRKLLSNTIYQQYEEVERELKYIKGGLQTRKYINENIAKGRWHKFNCIYDAFEIDNKFNRIIKYVANLLFNVTSNQDNKRNLRDILFILDEVSDVRVSAEECLGITFNPMFSCFETVRDYCYLFLKNSVSFNYKNELKFFAFLLPMEYVFEDFVFGFIEKEIKEVVVKSQVDSVYLDQNNKFAIRPDLIIEKDDKKIIADTKYKIVYNDKNDLKEGVFQNDLYQMLAYGVRFKIDEIKLFYPETIISGNDEEREVVIRDEWTEKPIDIKIKTYQLPIINRDLFEKAGNEEIELRKMFEEVKNKLTRRLKEILF